MFVRRSLPNNCLEQAVAARLIFVEPAKGCKLPKPEKKAMKMLSREKIGPYPMEEDKRGLLTACCFELTTGLRQGELLTPLWTGLDAEAKTIKAGEPHQGQAGGKSAKDTEFDSDTGDPATGRPAR